jgi:hypothetical protein
MRQAELRKIDANTSINREVARSLPKPQKFLNLDSKEENSQTFSEPELFNNNSKPKPQNFSPR